MLDSLRQDLRQALRALRLSPGFSLAAILSLGLGLGLNAALFTIVDALLWRPLPAAQPEQLVQIYTGEDGGKLEMLSSYPDLGDLRRTLRSVDELVGHSVMFAAVSDGGRNELVLGEVVTGNYFSSLGVTPFAGRLLQPADDTREAAPVVVVSQGFWSRRLGGDPSAIGRTIKVRGLPYTIVGVAPARFASLVPTFSAQLWVPVSRVEDVQPIGWYEVVGTETAPSRLDRRGARWLQVVGRLAPGATVASLQAELDVAMQHLANSYPDTNGHRRARVLAASDVRIHPLIDGPLFAGGVALLVMVGLVLLVAAANVANMLLARATARHREIGIRLAVGASRGRLVRQLVVESLVLALAGGGLGLALAVWATSLLANAPLPLPAHSTFQFAVDGRVFLFTAALATLTGLVFGLAPALRASRPDLVTSLKNEASRAGGGRLRLRSSLVVAQVAVTFVLLAGAGLLLKSLRASLASDLGLETRSVAVAQFDLDTLRLDRAQLASFQRDLLARLQARPEVAVAAFATRLPLSINIHQEEVLAEGALPDANGHGAAVDATRVTPGYLASLGIPLLAGRDIAPQDQVNAPRVVLVNQAMAAAFWPGRNPLGQRLHLGSADGPLAEVVGVTADYAVRTAGEAPRPMLHVAAEQEAQAAGFLLVRGRGPAAPLVPLLRQEIAALAPDLPLLSAETFEQMAATTLLPARLGSTLLGAFGLLALGLAALGLYGVIAYAVEQRTAEIGLRMAIGARPASVQAMVLRQGMRLVAAGLGIGLGIAVFLGTLLARAFYGLAAVEPLTCLAAALVLVAVALLANLLPARRAARLDPLLALRRGG